MAAVWRTLSDAFWSTSIWFPEGYSWKDLENDSSDVYYPQVQDINWSFAVGVVMLVLRYVYERTLIVPIAKTLGVKHRKRSVTPNPVLETAYRQHKGKINHAECKLLTKKTELSVREIERWILKRKRVDLPSSMVKFSECSWHFIFYTISFVYGMYILWHRQWFWEIEYCVIGWPKLHVDNHVYMFYLVELGFYWSLLLSSLTDVKRKDFMEQMAHHLLTIALLYLSWALNYVRYGAIIMVLHDAADYWMAAAKMAKYSKHQTVCEVLFGCFILVWLITRMGYYPFWVIRFIIFDHCDFSLTTGTTHKVFVALLCGLQVLHIFWTYMILRIVLQKFSHVELHDVRSDTESDDDYCDEDSVTEEKINGVKTTKQPQHKD